MSYIVMARKWRPQTFDTVVGQDAVVRTLKNAIVANRISHAYLFTGPRGVGKTTTARLLAKVVNCLSPVDGEPCNHCVRCEEIASGAATDVIEIDAASSGLVEDARDLREKVKYAPITCRYKVLIIDEVHMMSTAAFNALLKTLEEPPAHTMFILATTEAHKVPATIISRCQRFDFRRIPVKEIVERLRTMAAAENVTAADEALHAIARSADGSLRDAQSLFDQIISFSGNDIRGEDVVTILGLVRSEVFIDLVDAIAAHDAARALGVVAEVVDAGADLRPFMKDWVEYWRSLVIAAVVPDRHDEVLDVAANVLAAIERQARLFSLDELTALAKLVASADDELRRTPYPRTLLELLLVRLCSVKRVVSLEVLWNQLTAMEQRLASAPDRPAAVVPGSGAARAPEAPSAPADAVSGPAAAEPARVDSRPDVEGEPVLVADALDEAQQETHLARAKAAWPAVLKEVGQKNKRIEALLKDAVLTAADAGWVELTCLSPYHVTGLEKEPARKTVETALTGVLGAPMRMRLKVAPLGKTQEEGEPAGREDQAQQFEEIARKEPLVQKALELFGGKIVDVISKPSGREKP